MMSSMPVTSVRLAILMLLSEGPKSGRQLCEELEARTGQVWPVNADEVYAVLRGLECDGLVEPGGACGQLAGQGVHLPSMKVGCQSPSGQKKTEMRY
jgi:hypothetical protein